MNDYEVMLRRVEKLENISNDYLKRIKKLEQLILKLTLEESFKKVTY